MIPFLFLGAQICKALSNSIFLKGKITENVDKNRRINLNDEEEIKEVAEGVWTAMKGEDVGF